MAVCKLLSPSLYALLVGTNLLCGTRNSPPKVGYRIQNMTNNGTRIEIFVPFTSSFG